MYPYLGLISLSFSSSSSRFSLLFGDQKWVIFGLPPPFIIKVSFITFLVLPHSINYTTISVIYTLASSFITSCILCLFLTNYTFVLKSCKIFGFLNFYIFVFNLRRFNLWLQNTLNMLKTIRVYFDILHNNFGLLTSKLQLKVSLG